jgi:hypothetical protein
MTKKKVTRKAKAPKASVRPVDPKIPGVTAAELSKLVGRYGHSRKAVPGMFSEPTLPTVDRPSWMKGLNERTKVPYVKLQCVCNADTIWELRGDGKAPTPNCCVNAPAYPQEGSFQLHLHIRVNDVDASGVRGTVDNYDRKVDTTGGRADAVRIGRY